MNDFWKDIKGYEGVYRASRSGKIKSLSRRIRFIHSSTKTECFRQSKEKMMIGSIGSGGYLMVALSNGKEPKYIRIHQIIAETFLDYAPDGNRKIVIDHIDEDKLNNADWNLRIVTNRFNCTRNPKGKSNLVGAQWCNTSKKWKSQVRYNGKRIYVGSFNTDLEAHNAYKSKLVELNEV